MIVHGTEDTVVPMEYGDDLCVKHTKMLRGLPLGGMQSGDIQFLPHTTKRRKNR